MTIGERIKKYRKVAGMTQRELAEKCGSATGTIQQYELDKRQPRVEQLQKIAHILNVSVSELLGTVQRNEHFWTSYLNDKLKQIGCRIVHDEDNAMTWIEFPDGHLEITNQDLKDLDDSTVSYLLFKLEELKKKNIKDFRPKRK